MQEEDKDHYNVLVFLKCIQAYQFPLTEVIFSSLSWADANKIYKTFSLGLNNLQAQVIKKKQKIWHQMISKVSINRQRVHG